MLFTSTDWTTVISEAAGVLVILGSGWRWLKKHDPALVNDIPQGVRHVLDEGATIIGDLARTPWFASEAAAGKLELRHVTDKLLQSHIGQAAAQALASFGKSLANMSQSEQGTAVEMVQAALQAVGQTVTPQQALTALQVADAAITKLSAVAKAATERSQALQPAQATQTQSA